MSDMNNLSIVGRLTRDPELKHTQGGAEVCSFSIAVSKTFTQDGEKKEQTSFFNCVAWANLAKTISSYVKKGHRIGVCGSIQQRSWDDQNGNKRSVVEIVARDIMFLQPKQDSGQAKTPIDNNAFPGSPFSDEAIPF